MVHDKPVYVTAAGLEKLKQELEHLTSVKRPEMIERLHEAKGGGDWMDQTEDVLIQSELAFLEGRIQELEHMLATAEIIEPGGDDTMVNIGDTVVLQANGSEMERYTIVGVAEADPGAGRISNESPLGRAVLDQKVGEEVDVETPDGTLHYRIVAVT